YSDPGWRDPAVTRLGETSPKESPPNGVRLDVAGPHAARPDEVRPARPGLTRPGLTQLIRLTGPACPGLQDPVFATRLAAGGLRFAGSVANLGYSQPALDGAASAQQIGKLRGKASGRL